MCQSAQCAWVCMMHTHAHWADSNLRTIAYECIVYNIWCVTDINFILLGILNNLNANRCNDCLFVRLFRATNRDFHDYRCFALSIGMCQVTTSTSSLWASSTSLFGGITSNLFPLDFLFHWRFQPPLVAAEWIRRKSVLFMQTKTRPRCTFLIA